MSRRRYTRRQQVPSYQGHPSSCAYRRSAKVPRRVASSARAPVSVEPSLVHVAQAFEGTAFGRTKAIPVLCSMEAVLVRVSERHRDLCFPTCGSAAGIRSWELAV